MIKLIDDHFEEALLVFLLSAMSLLIGAQVFMRYVMLNSLTWSEELARYCFIWATYIGVSYGVKRKAHICVTALSERLSGNSQRYLHIFAYAVFGLFAFMVMKEGWALAMKIFRFGQKSSSLGIYMGWIYLAPTLSFGLVVLRLLQAVSGEIRAIRQGA
ncbi:TRAP transporter small permease [uncultured Castellaniella sp.]|uniref:TRAP transporter small permease n=1 Tax=uncultured Castellaniella sp. TaxID=647907 RepID=UPI00261EA063|nr:TRAP transporter small permease [uncultured Castellaniella sp.]